MKVDVVRATAEGACCETLDLPTGATVEDVLAATRLASPPPAQVAIFGRPAAREHVLAEGERVELLAGLVVDPRTARRERAKLGGS